MKAKSVPPPKSEGQAPEDQTTERLIAAVESAIGVMQEHFANLAEDNQDTKWSVADLVRLLQLRNQLQADRPRTISVRWVDDTVGSKSKEHHNE